jgi:methyltransferase (TIGR00027 family)
VDESGERPLAGVSRTAVWVAAMRATEGARPDRLFDDPLAAAFTAAAAKHGIGGVRQDVPSVDMTGVDDLIAVRTAYFDQQVVDAGAAGVRQVVEPAAGLDGRAFRVDWPAGVRLFELDLPGLFTFKESVAAAAGAKPRCARTIVPVDLRDDWAGALVHAGFAAHEPTVWLVEGLLPYLDAPATERLLGTIDDLSAPGGSVTFDHLAPEVAQRPVMRTVSEVVRDFGAELLTTEDDPVGVLGTRGWQVDTTPMPALAERYDRPNANAVDPVGMRTYLVSVATR